MQKLLDVIAVQERKLCPQLKLEIPILNSNLEKLQAKQHVATKLIPKYARTASTSATYANNPTNANDFHFAIFI